MECVRKMKKKEEKKKKKKHTDLGDKVSAKRLKGPHKTHPLDHNEPSLLSPLSSPPLPLLSSLSSVLQEEEGTRERRWRDCDECERREEWSDKA